MKNDKEQKSEEVFKVMCALDRLRYLIRDERKRGHYTLANSHEEYYNKVRSHEKIKHLLGGTAHENPIPEEPLI
jgi:hypothetical protein